MISDSFSILKNTPLKPEFYTSLSSKVSFVAKHIFTRWVALAIVSAASCYLIYRVISHYLGNKAVPVAPPVEEAVPPADEILEPVEEIAPPVDEVPEPVAPPVEEPVPPVDEVPEPVEEPVPHVDEVPEPVAPPTDDALRALDPFQPYALPVALGSFTAASASLFSYYFRNEDVGPIARMAALGTLAAASVGLVYYAGSYYLQNRAPEAPPVVAAEDRAVEAAPPAGAPPIAAAEDPVVEAAPVAGAPPIAAAEDPVVEAAPPAGAPPVVAAGDRVVLDHGPIPEEDLIADFLAEDVPIDQIFEVLRLDRDFSPEQIALRDFLLPVLGPAAQAFVRFIPPGARIVQERGEFRITFDRERHVQGPRLRGCTISVPRGDLIVRINRNQVTFRGALFSVSHPVDGLAIPPYLGPFLPVLGNPIVAEIHGMERVGETLRPTIYLRSVRALVPNVSITRFLPYRPFQNIGKYWLLVRWPE